MQYRLPAIDHVTILFYFISLFFLIELFFPLYYFPNATSFVKKRWQVKCFNDDKVFIQKSSQKLLLARIDKTPITRFFSFILSFYLFSTIFLTAFVFKQMEFQCVCRTDISQLAGVIHQFIDQQYTVSLLGNPLEVAHTESVFAIGHGK